MRTMRILPFVLCLAAVLAAITADAGAQSVWAPGWINAYRDTATRLIKAATADDFAWQRLAEMTDTYGHRLSGSENLNRAIGWAVETMKKDGLENVRAEKVMVTRWVRGRESAEIVDPARHTITLLGLGGTVATPPGGLEAEVLVVESFNDLRTHAADAKGRIVLFNEPLLLSAVFRPFASRQDVLPVSLIGRTDLPATGTSVTWMDQARSTASRQ